MAGKPQREAPKRSIQIHIDEEVYQSVLPLFNSGRVTFTSFSQLVETIVFLSKHMYAEEPDNGFVNKLASLKYNRTVKYLANVKPAQRCVHLTLDEDAVGFLNMLQSRHRVLFESRGEVLNLLLANIAFACKDPDNAAYYGNRLAEVFELNPPRKR